MFIRNAWYVAGLSADFGRRLDPLRMLADDIVLFREPDGTPVALEDACPHRKLPLSCGRLDGARVVCGYHGLTFDRSGACVAAPTQPDAIPRQARLRSYPARDRWGFLWIWMGAPEQADPGLIPDIPNFDDPNWGRTPLGAMEIACDYRYILDNLLDPSHVAWVHVSSFAGAGTEDGPLITEKLEDGLIVYRWVLGRMPPPYYADLVGFRGPCDRNQHYECRLPSTAINMSVYTPAGTGGPDVELPPEAYVNISYNFITPVDADNARYFWFQHRNRDPDDADISARMFAGAKGAFAEDKAILEQVHHGMKHRRTPYLHLGLDAAANRFRRLAEKRVESEAEG